jgi:histone acetyltransferase (RNA polymerase elongator complex component)
MSMAIARIRREISIAAIRDGVEHAKLRAALVEEIGEEAVAKIEREVENGKHTRLLNDC